MQNHLVQHSKLVSLIFLVGISNAIISVFVLYFSQLQGIQSWQIMYLQSSFFMCYFLVVPSGFLLLQYIKYESLLRATCLICGLLAATMGICMHYQKTQSLYVFLSLFAVFLGLLRVIVNTQLLKLQKEPNYYSWIKYIMCADTVGAILCPTIARPFLLSAQTIWGGPLKFFGFVCTLFLLIRCISTQPQTTPPKKTNKVIVSSMSLIQQAMRTPQIYSGFIVLFLFLGLEFSTPIFIGLLNPNDSALSSSALISAYWSFILIGRVFIGLRLSLTPQQHIYLGTLGGLFYMMLCLCLPKIWQPIALTALGLFNANLYPSIFSLYTKNIPEHLHYLTSGIFMTALCGGAWIPYIQSLLANHIGYQNSFCVIATCYIILIAQTTQLSEPQVQTK